MNLNFETLQKILSRYNIDHVDHACDYGEPGYTLDSDKQGILFANWNNAPSYLMSAIEKQYEIEWSDEWYIACESCPSLAYRTSADSYSWTPSIMFCDGYVLTPADAESDPESVLAEIINDANRVNIFDIDLESLGFEKLNDDYFETGFHAHQTDSPSKILAELQEKHPNGEFVFSDLSAGQFDRSYNIYGRKLEKPKPEKRIDWIKLPALMTIDEWQEYRGSHQGYCLACKEWTRDMTEPDARNYDCPCCEKLEVYGDEELLIMGLVSEE